MLISVCGFCYHKPSETFEDCADKIAFSLDNEIAKFAISDGVTVSWYPETWANILVNQYVSVKGLSFNLNNTEVDDTLLFCQNKWLDEIATNDGESNQPWWVENINNKKSSGSATFTGITFMYEDDLLKWNAISIGDSFLYILSNDGTLRGKIPKNDEFNNTPNYLDSRGKHKGIPITEIGNVESGYYILMTDALAEWFSLSPINKLPKVLSWETYETFRESIDLLRQNKEIKIDDTAFIIINVKEPGTNNKVIVKEWWDGFEMKKNIETEVFPIKGRKISRRRILLNNLSKNIFSQKLNPKNKKRKLK